MASNGPSKRKTPVLKVNDDCITNPEDDSSFENLTEAWANPSVSTVVPDVVQQLKDANRQMVSQIHILKGKVKIDETNRNAAKETLVNKSNQQLQTKEVEINSLTCDLHEKEKKVEILTEENERKQKELTRLHDYISELTKDVHEAKEYSRKIQSQLAELLKKANGQKNSEKDTQIVQLRTEIDNMKENLVIIEKELSAANRKIAEQGNNIRLMQIESGHIQIKFKQDMAKVTRIMQNEIERMREVMTDHNREIRELKKENHAMSDDIKEIRRMVTMKQSSEFPDIQRQNNSKVQNKKKK